MVSASNTISPHESWISAPGLYAVSGGARTKNIRLGPMGYIVPLYNSLRLGEEIPLRLAPASGLWHAVRDLPADVTGSSHGGAG
jgi:hypothetical protein